VNGSAIRDAGDSALVLELDDVIDEAVNDRAIAIARGLEAQSLAGVRDVVPTYRTVAVFFDPLEADPAAIRDALERSRTAPPAIVPGRLFEVPVRYGGVAGPDLNLVADYADLAPDEVVERHAASEYRVFMLGFMPGFAYLGLVDERIAAPRHPTPRMRVPAGAVGIAGRQTGIYSIESPGGWQIIGRTSLRAFDAFRTPPSLFRPGDRVRFVPEHRWPSPIPAPGSGAALPPAAPRPPATRYVSVVRPGLLTTVQDGGRWGHQAVGVPVSGALDLEAHRLANALVDNDPAAATLEATLAGPELSVDGPTTVAVTGADLGATLDGHPLTPGSVAACRQPATLRFDGRRRGARAYLAFSGGIVTPAVLGSRSTHVRAGLGGVEGRALRADDRLPLGDAPRKARSLKAGPPAGVATLPPGGTRLRVLRGPHEEYFPSGAIDRLCATRFTVSPQSDRMGYRLASTDAIPRLTARELISEVTVPGALQVPPSGQPILLMADRQTTGGYPQIAIVITADLPRAAQLMPGDWVEFEPCSRDEALAALRDGRSRDARG
jgi:KipI family sensor histidine kinase inhibitor